MKLSVLGWQGPVPGAKGACSGYLLENDWGEALLLDLGGGSLGRLFALRSPATVSAILLSHLHWDHISDMLPLSYLAGMTQKPVYAPSGPEAPLAVLKEAGWNVLPCRDMEIGHFSIRFFSGRHPVPANAIRIASDGKTLVYTGDTNTLPGLTEFAHEADLLLADAGLCEADWAEEKPHLSPRLCGQLAREAKAKRLLITHFAAKNRPDALLEEACAVFSSAEAACDGLQTVL